MAGLTLDAVPSPAPSPAPSRRGGLRRRRTRRQSAFRWVVVTVLGAFFLLPLLAMLEFTTRGPGGRVSFATWSLLLNWKRLGETYPDLWGGITASFGQTVLTVLLTLVLLVPTVIWVRLRLPRLRRVVEFACLLPLTIPAIVLVVGLAPVYAWVTYFLGGSSLTLTFAYTILALPFAYRAIDAGLSAIDVRTLSEAARSLGANWATVMWRVVLPNIRSAVLSAAFLTVAAVLGEFTIASLLIRSNLQVQINFLGKSNAQVSIAASFAALVIAFVMLLLLSLVGRGRRRDVAGPEVAGRDITGRDAAGPSASKENS